MKKSLLLICVLGLLSFGFTSNKKVSYLNGTWDEYWGLEMGSDVTDVDRLEIIATSPKDISITCITSDHYAYTNAKCTGKTFTFTMQNMSSSEPFFVYYTLKRVNNDLIKGMIKNSEGTKTDLQLKRVVVEKS